MSKFLVQTKTFLPMVIQKSTADTVHIFENHPSLCSQPLKKVEVIESDTQKHSEPNDENIKILIQQNMEISKVITVCRERERSLLEALLMDVAQMQDMVTMMWARGHLWLWGQSLGMLRSLQGPAAGTSLLWIEGRPRLKEEEPVPVTLPEGTKKKAPPSTPKPGKTEGKVVEKKEKNEKTISFNSNLLDTILERSPAWQAAIAARLGALQRTVVLRLTK